MADVNLENAASPEAQLEEIKVEHPEGIENGPSQWQKSYTIDKKLQLLIVCKYDELGGNKTKVTRKC